MKGSLFLLAAAAAAAPAVAALAVNTSVPLNKWPMVYTHDSATAYLSEGVLKDVVYGWARTQKATTTGQLDCGARALDWRVKVVSGKLEFHHSSFNIDYPLASALAEVVTWANAHPAPEDLVMLSVSHLEGDNALSMVNDALKAAGVAAFPSCDEVGAMTLGSALQRSALPGGGHVLAVDGCISAHWDDTVACSGYGTKRRLGGEDDEGRYRGASSAAAAASMGCIPAGVALDAPLDAMSDAELQQWELCLKDLVESSRAGESASMVFGLTYNCYADSSSKDFPFQRMNEYIDGVAAADPAGAGLYSIQALWQETTASVTLGVLAGSNLLEDEERSELNALVAKRIANGELPHANLVELNNVCHGGPDVLAALRGAFVGATEDPLELAAMM